MLSKLHLYIDHLQEQRCSDFESGWALSGHPKPLIKLLSWCILVSNQKKNGGRSMHSFNHLTLGSSTASLSLLLLQLGTTFLHRQHLCEDNSSPNQDKPNEVLGLLWILFQPWPTPASQPRNSSVVSSSASLALMNWGVDRLLLHSPLSTLISICYDKRCAMRALILLITTGGAQRMRDQ